MVLKLYNSLTNKLEDFKPVHEGLVRMYNCGPTVYSFAHIGNFRSFIVIDILRRFLEYSGFEVRQVVNITDVGHLTGDDDTGEDKLEVSAKKEQKHPLEIAQFYTDAFLRDWKNLHLEEPEFRPKATETVPEMIALVEELLKRGHAYEAGGNIYYDITSFPDYGKLSGNSIDKLTNSRVDDDPNKRNPHDFVLWFGNSKFKNHILKWDSPWGEGYPGWHIECSSMSAKLLTDAFNGGKFDPDKFETIDIHSGGEDNKFPHHECEIAQTEGATGKKFSNYWLHIRHLMSEGEKMSKSLGNFYYVNGLLEEGYSWRAIRYLLISTQYRLPLNFTKEGLVASQKAIDRIDEVLKRLDSVRSTVDYNEPLATIISSMKLSVEKEMENDLNVSGALGAIFESIKEINKALDADLVGEHQAKEILDAFFSVEKIFGFFPKEVVFKEEDLPEEVLEILEDRRIARENKDWVKSDALRDKLKELGFLVTDTKNGQDCKKI
jgi:cysteinyl-tRNA synthetase